MGVQVQRGGGGGKCNRRVKAERGRSLQQLITFFQLELPDRQVPEERVRVDARAVDVEDVLEGVEHVLKGLRERFDDFSDDVRAYLQNFFASVCISQSIEGMYGER